MKSILTLLLVTLTSFAFCQTEPVATSDFTIGETKVFHSDILNQERTVHIYLPYGYHKDSLKEYPVIYLLDGSEYEDFIHITGLVQFNSYSWINEIPETIVVGISNIDRKHDFTYPTTNAKDKEDFPTTGGSEKFINFLKDELQPLIDSSYNVNATKTIIGQSLGGLLATEILYKQPDMFDNYIIISPSIWWDDQSLFDLEFKESVQSKSVYIGVGKEGKMMEKDAKSLYKKLSKVAPINMPLHFNFFKKKDHGDVLHTAVSDAIDVLFN